MAGGRVGRSVNHITEGCKCWLRSWGGVEEIGFRTCDFWPVEEECIFDERGFLLTMMNQENAH